MFNFFGNRDKQSSDLNSFRDTFNKNQKGAIVSVLIIVANSDGRINNKEEAHIHNVVSILDISLSDPILKQLTTLGRGNLINILNTLNRGQKEWLLLSLYELAHCDGPVAQIETSYCAGIAADIGYTETQYLTLIQKTSHLRKNFR